MTGKIGNQTNCTYNEDLKKERENCNFVKEEITHLLDGSKEKTELRKSLENKLFNDPEFDDPLPTDYMSHEERYSNELRKGTAIIRKLNGDEELQHLTGEMEGIRMLIGNGIGSALVKDGNPFMVHYVMFLPTIIGQGTVHQQSHWIGKAWSGEVIGTYAQTELGHGTFLKRLETTATYEPHREEFILNTPTTSSYKFWPGGLGKTANHAVVMAQLYTNGQCYGPHAFIVQIRDSDNHRSLPGVIIGEVGAKFGVNTNDNGYLAFQNYRIPRENMLMKHAQVEQDGTYVKPLSNKLTYGTMVFVRVEICLESARQLQKAVTIATRYSAVRRQSELVPGEREPQILDYQTQQEKLFPNIAAVFGLIFAGHNLRKQYQDIIYKAEEGDLQLLPELHAISCGLKALCSSDAAKGIDVCRRSCGGFGYLNSSNFPRLYTAATAAETYEGENTVMWLQIARFLIKVFMQPKSQNRSPILGFLCNNVRPPSSHGLMNEDLLIKWQSVLVYIARRITHSILNYQSEGLHYELACNKSSVLLVSFAQAFMRYFVCSGFVDRIMATEVSLATKVLLNQLCRLYILHYILENEGLFLRSGSITLVELQLLEKEKFDIFTRLRKVVVCVVDSFDLHDRILDSTLGAYDGNVYERILEEAKKSPLNRTDVPDAYYKYLQPLMKSKL